MLKWKPMLFGWEKFISLGIRDFGIQLLLLLEGVRFAISQNKYVSPAVTPWEAKRTL